MYHDLETLSDVYELEQGYRAECAAELALETGASYAVLDELEESIKSLAERLEAHAQELAELQRLEQEMFEAWLS